MSTRRQLVSRQRLNEESSPAPRSRQRDSEAAPRRTSALPPYEPPTCPLTPAAKRALDELRVNHDYSKYKKHLTTSMTTLTVSAGEINDRLHARKKTTRVRAEKRREQGREEKTAIELEDEEYADKLGGKVEDLTAKAEKALREMIDYRDEITMQDIIMKDVSDNLPAAPAQHARRARNDDEENEDPEEGVNEEAADIPGVSAVELLEKAKGDYATRYAAKSMLSRYDLNEYVSFKRTVHDAIHGDNAPPVPHANTWFPQDRANGSAASRSRTTSTIGNTNNRDDDDMDEDLVIEGASINLKCPLTLQHFKEPYSSKVCKHSFEKSAILEYHRNEAVSFGQPSQRGRGRGQPEGPKKVKCPQTGCDAMLEINDFYVDPVLLRQVKRQQRQDAHEDEEDDAEEDAVPRGTQRTRPEPIDSDVDEDGHEQEQNRKEIMKIKRERAQSRGLSAAPSR